MRYPINNRIPINGWLNLAWIHRYIMIYPIVTIPLVRILSRGDRLQRALYGAALPALQQPTCSQVEGYPRGTARWEDWAIWAFWAIHHPSIHPPTHPPIHPSIHPSTYNTYQQNLSITTLNKKRDQWQRNIHKFLHHHHHHHHQWTIVFSFHVKLLEGSRSTHGDLTYNTHLDSFNQHTHTHTHAQIDISTKRGLRQ